MLTAIALTMSIIIILKTTGLLPLAIGYRGWSDIILTGLLTTVLCTGAGTTGFVVSIWAGLFISLALWFLSKVSVGKRMATVVRNGQFMRALVPIAPRGFGS